MTTKSDAPVAMFYEEIGEGKPLLCLHGFPFDHTIWHPVAQLLKMQARFILPDLRGHGQSPAPIGVYGMRLLAEDVVRLLDQLALEQVTLVGHSMGGYVALAFAQAYPDRLSGLGLIATQAAADTPEHRQSRLKLARSVSRSGAKPVVKSMIEKLTTDPQLRESLASLMLATPKPGLSGSLRGMAERPDRIAELSNIQVPTLVVSGVEDRILKLEAQQVMTQMLSRGWAVEIAGAGHMAMLEAPAAVADALRQLISMQA